MAELKKITAFGGRVYPYRTIRQQTAPYVVARTPSETVNPEQGAFGSAGKPVLFREAMLEIEVRAKASSDLDGVMDGYAVSIEKAMAGTALDALAVYVWLSETSIVTADDDEAIEKDAALMTLTYRVGYRTVEGSAEKAIL